MDPIESSKRLEMNVKRVSSVKVSEEPTPDGMRATMASPEVSYVGSMVGEEEGYPTGSRLPESQLPADESSVEMRRRVLEAPLGSKIGYHELEDEKEEADVEWMTGEASQLSGAGTRGSSNWVLKIILPISLIIGIIILHSWWTEVKKHASNAAKGVGDVFDRRALAISVQGEQEEQARQVKGAAKVEAKAGVAGDSASGTEVHGMAGDGARQAPKEVGLPDKAVYSVNLEDAGANADNENTQA
eukprot:g16307.t1